MSWEHLLDFHDITDQDVKEIVGGKNWNGEKMYPINTKHSDNARRAILKLYTLETPLYKTLNRANACQDERAI